MSVIRWGTDGSNVYVIVQDTTKGVAYHCVCCGLKVEQDGRTDFPEGVKDGFFYSKEELRRHLSLHRLCGDVVPDKAFVLEGNDDLETYMQKPNDDGESPSYLPAASCASHYS